MVLIPLMALLIAYKDASPTITHILDSWEGIGNVSLILRFDDADNGDGMSDGAISVKAVDSEGIRGIQYTFQGTMQEGQQYSIETAVYNYTSSFVRYRVQLFRPIDSTVLVQSNRITITGNITEPVITTLSYTALQEDAGKALQLRYIRDDDGHTARAFAVDIATLNGNPLPSFRQVFWPKPVIDIPSVAPTKRDSIEIDSILVKMLRYMIGTTPPTSSQLAAAVTAYNEQNITVNNYYSISGKEHTLFDSWKEADYLKTFARYLVLNPTDTTVATMAINTVWLFCDQFYKGMLPLDYINYYYKLLAAPAVFLLSYLNEWQFNLFYYSLYKHSRNMVFFWSPEYVTGQTTTGAINIDDIGNISDIQLVFGLCRNSYEEKIQWLKGFNRYYERFLTYSPATSDGIKSDGSSFHHQSALNNYTYNYNTLMRIVDILDGAQFQISQKAYLVLRDAIYTQLILANDNVEPLSMTCRHPQARHIAPSRDAIRQLAVTGGKIMGMNGPDTILAKACVRMWGADPRFVGISAESPQGFFQFNYHVAGAFWQDGWLAVARGHTNWSFGVERILNTNIYGRYQAHGALEIIYSGGQENGNGYRFNGWNWNYNPGATTIVLPWVLLKFENEHQKEYQRKGFAGSLVYNNVNSPVLSANHGTLGMFAMDYHCRETNWGSVPLGPNTHDTTFRFKKSVFFLGEYIIALGSNIYNKDSNNVTVTTLYQRLSENRSGVNINGSLTDDFGESSFPVSENPLWIIDNFNTGYYIPNNNDTVRIRRELQKIPFQTQQDHTLAESNPAADYSIGFIDHGAKPESSGYEFVILPSTTPYHMDQFASKTKQFAKPYSIIRKDKYAHIVKCNEKKITACAFFEPSDSLNSEILPVKISHSSLLMYQENNDGSLNFSLSRPELGYGINDFTTPIPVVTVTLEIRKRWTLLSDRSGVTIAETTDSSTVLLVTLTDGLATEARLHNATTDTEKNNATITPYLLTSPNPANPSMLIRVNGKIYNNAAVSIFSLSGQLIHKTTICPKQQTATWNGRDSYGNTVSSGVYIIHYSDKKQVLMKKAALLK